LAQVTRDFWKKKKNSTFLMEKMAKTSGSSAHCPLQTLSDIFEKHP
jgi:hypothetical protein